MVSNCRYTEWNIFNRVAGNKFNITLYIRLIIEE